MHLFTFIMEYNGGTYISQVHASNKHEAMRGWITTLKVDEIPDFRESDRKKIIAVDFNEEAPVLISGMKNVWHFLVNTKKGVGYINFIKTIKR